MAKPRIYELDFLRAVACLTVIVTHVTASVISLPYGSEGVRAVFLAVNRFCISNVPIFVFISGVALYYRYGGEPLAYGLYLKKRVKGVLLPYLLWTAAYYGVFLLLGIYLWNPWFLLKSVLLGTMVYHLYFVVMLLQFYLLFPLFKWAFDRFRGHGLLVGAFVINWLFFRVTAAAWRYFGNLYLDRFFVQYLFYFVLGCYLAKYYSQWRQRCRFSWGLLGVGVLLTALKVWSLVTVYQTGAPVAGFLDHSRLWLIFSGIDILFYSWVAGWLTPHLSAGVNKAVAAVSGGSYEIYLMHPLFLMVGEKLLARLGITSLSLNGLGLLLLTAVPTLVLAIGYTRWRKNKRVPRPQNG